MDENNVEQTPASQRLTNEDFRKLLMTPRATPGGSGGSHPAGSVREAMANSGSMPPPAENKGELRRKKKSYYAALKKQEDNKLAELAEKYRDRARERRDGTNELGPADPTSNTSSAYRAVAPDLKSGMDAKERRRQLIQESKYLGGDMEHTHLVKGLDYALLQKVRSEIQTREQEQEAEMERLVTIPVEPVEKKKEVPVEEEIQFETPMAKNIYNMIQEQRTKKVIRNEMFGPGRMAYVVELDEEGSIDSDIPTTLTRSKADVPEPDRRSSASSANDVVLDKLAQIFSYLRHGRHRKPYPSVEPSSQCSDEMESTPICRCRVLYLGSAVPQQSKDGLQGIQEPLRELYPDKGATNSGIDSWLSVWSNGILLENIDESGSRVARFFPISSLHYCAAVRRVTVEGAPRFLPLDSPFARAPAPRRPPLFAAVLRRTQGIKVLECHAFICRREAAANALVRCCFHAYADSSYAKRLEAERAPPQLPPDDEELEVYDGDENHKVWVGETERDDASDDIPHPARAPRPRQIARPASVPPPPPPPEEPKKKTATTKKMKKKSSASADELYAGPAPVMNGRSLGRAPPAWAAAHPMVLVAHPAATLPHARHATLGHRGRVPAALAAGPYPPGPPGPARARLQYATVDPRRSKPPPPAMKAAQSMTGLEAVEDAGGIYRKKGHLNERAFSYSIRQEHRSRSHGSLANLKFAAPPEVESGREELKKEREIMQLVAGLQLGDDERRELPHVMRQRHAPR